MMYGLVLQIFANMEHNSRFILFRIAKLKILLLALRNTIGRSNDFLSNKSFGTPGQFVIGQDARTRENVVEITIIGDLPEVVGGWARVQALVFGTIASQKVILQPAVKPCHAQRRIE
jgi:hypothetical protein